VRKFFITISLLLLLFEANAIISRYWSLNYSFQYHTTSNFNNGIELTIYKTGGYAVMRKYYKHSIHFEQIKNNNILIYNFSKSIYTKTGNSQKEFHLHLRKKNIEKHWRLNCYPTIGFSNIYTFENKKHSFAPQIGVSNNFNIRKRTIGIDIKYGYYFGSIQNKNHHIQVNTFIRILRINYPKYLVI